MNVYIDENAREEMAPHLKEDGLTFSAWIRREQYRYLRQKREVKEGRTQLDPRVMGDHAA
jgi:hypothetical protein